MSRVYIHICEKSFTMGLLLRVNDPQLDLPMEWVLYSSLSLKKLFKNKSILPAFSSFEETKVWVPFVRVKRKGILVSPLRPLPTVKNGLCMDLPLNTCVATITFFFFFFKHSSLSHLCFLWVLFQEERVNFYWCFPFVSFLFNFLRVIFRVINYSATLSCSSTSLCLEHASSP